MSDTEKTLTRQSVEAAVEALQAALRMIENEEERSSGPDDAEESYWLDSDYAFLGGILHDAAEWVKFAESRTNDCLTVIAVAGGAGWPDRVHLAKVEENYDLPASLQKQRAMQARAKQARWEKVVAKIDLAVDEAQHGGTGKPGFWDAIVRHFPEVQEGHDTGFGFDFDAAAKEAVRKWLEVNHPDSPLADA